MEKRGLWTVLDRKTVYKNLWMEVYEDNVIRPDGKKGVYGTFKIKPGVVVLPLDENGFVYLTEEFHYGVGRVTIEAVAGGIDESETPIAAAKRELKEELGIEGKQWIELGVVEPLTSFVNCPHYLFLVKKLTFGKINHDGTEVIKPVKVKFEKTVEMVLNSEIPHAASVCLILKAKEYLKK